MLLMITVSLAGVFYVFSSAMASQTTSSGSEQASQLTAQLSMCMQIDNIVVNRITLRNCGKGVIENKSLVVMMDDIALGVSTNTIQEGNSSVVNISGLWQVPFGKHSLKISNGAAVAQSLIEIISNPDGLAGSWNFDEGSGAKAYDASGNGNVGTLTNMNTTGNATSGWTAGKFGSGLQSDGVNDYVNLGSRVILNNIGNEISVSAWVKTSVNSGAQTIVGRGNDWRLEKFDNSYWFEHRNSNNNIVISAGTSSSTGWVYIVGTCARDTFVKLYINGILVQSLPQTLSTRVSQTENQIGNNYAWHGGGTYNDYYFSGAIDEVRIWNRALSPDETVAMKQII